MSQQVVGILINRLVRDADLRMRLIFEPVETLAGVQTLGLELTPDEMDLFLQANAWTWFVSDSIPGLRQH
jgi:hypothetical protein